MKEQPKSRELMPIHSTDSKYGISPVPFEWLSEKNAESFHDQNLSKLAGRGGLSVREMLFNMDAISRDEVSQEVSREETYVRYLKFILAYKLRGEIIKELKSERVSGETPKPDPETVRAVIIDPEKMHLATDAIRDLDLLLDQTQNPEYKVIKELSQTLDDCLIVETPEQYREGWTQMLLTQELEHSQGLEDFLWEIANHFKIEGINEDTETEELIEKIREKVSGEAKTPDREQIYQILDAAEGPEEGTDAIMKYLKQ